MSLLDQAKVYEAVKLVLRGTSDDDEPVPDDATEPIMMTLDGKPVPYSATAERVLDVALATRGT